MQKLVLLVKDHLDLGGHFSIAYFNVIEPRPELLTVTRHFSHFRAHRVYLALQVIFLLRWNALYVQRCSFYPCTFIEVEHRLLLLLVNLLNNALIIS